MIEIENFMVNEFSTTPVSGTELAFELILNEISPSECLALSTISKNINAMIDNNSFWSKRSTKLHPIEGLSMRSQLIFSLCVEFSVVQSFLVGGLRDDFQDYLQGKKHKLLFLDQSDSYFNFKVLSKISKKESINFHRLNQILKLINAELWKKKTFILQVLSAESLFGEILMYIDKELWNDKDFILRVLPLVPEYCSIEQFLPRNVLIDKPFIIKYVSLVKSPCHILKIINQINECKEFWNDKDFVLGVLSYDNLIAYLPERFLSDAKFIGEFISLASREHAYNLLKIVTEKIEIEKSINKECIYPYGEKIMNLYCLRFSHFDSRYNDLMRRLQLDPSNHQMTALGISKLNSAQKEMFIQQIKSSICIAHNFS